MSSDKKGGIDYQHNYDVVFKWITNVFIGETLDVLGISTGKITEVRGLEPITLEAKQERIDLLLKDDNDCYFHLEEERGFKLQDLYRFAAQHFLIAKQIDSDRLTTIIIASGQTTTANSIRTQCGSFVPLIVDFNDRDGEEKLEQFKRHQSVNPVELVFLPMFGVHSKSRDQFAEDVLLYARDLYLAHKVPLEILGALVVICNKMIPVEALASIWRELTMLTAFKYAEQKGKTEGKIEGKIEELLEVLSWTAPDIVRKYEQEIKSAKTEQQLEVIKKNIKAELDRR